MTWDEAFADRYEEWSADMTADVTLYAELAVEAGGPLVELAIGNGRVAIPVARATGQRVIGIDSSPAMLDQARARAAHRPVRGRGKQNRHNARQRRNERTLVGNEERVARAYRRCRSST